MADALPAVLTLMVTCAESVVTEAGLKLHVAPAGRPLQAKVMVPTPMLEFTSSTVEVVPPAVTSRFKISADNSNGDVTAGFMVVTSVAVSLPALASPPPETVAVLVTDRGALRFTETVSVISGKLRPGSMVSAREELVSDTQIQPGPLMAVAFKPAGSVSVTVTGSVVVAPPTLVTVIV